MDKLHIGDKLFDSRLFLGTGKFSSLAQMTRSIAASETQLVTLALRRINPAQPDFDLASELLKLKLQLFPNTSGARTADEALMLAHMSRELLNSSWLKLEIHPDPRYLLPDPVETLKACDLLVQQGFTVLPYVNADPVLCKRLEEVGAAAVMPLAAPIGSNQGLKTKAMLEIIIEQSQVPVVVDAGLGAPSHAAEAMELGADAVLVNSAIAASAEPVLMAAAFSQAVQAGRSAYCAGLAGRSQQARSTSDFTSFLELQ
ncbi:thiazole synthase [Agaribacterium haliotis]|uniref:thiazole synthase n=1 Tax=Agaribacterium haliotis TaxID=2013869 RepID=UPI000BB5316E|nr:thiazole synthase [Agaribacterium haliotis]